MKTYIEKTQKYFQNSSIAKPCIVIICFQNTLFRLILNQQIIDMRFVSMFSTPLFAQLAGRASQGSAKHFPKITLIVATLQI